MRPRVTVSWQNLVFSLICWMAFHGVALHAGDLIPPITPEELAMKSEPLAPGAPAIILFRLVQRDDNGRTSHEDNFVRIKILNEEGLKYANREIPFVKGRDNVVNVKAHTIRPDGSVVNYDGKLTEQTIVKSRGLKYLAKTLALPDVHPGSIIEYSYTYDLTEHLIYDSHWILSEDLFTRRAIFTLKPYNGRFNVRWSWQGLPPGTEPPKEGPDHIIRMEARNVPAFQTEDFMPPANELKSRVDFTYSDNYGDANPATFWKNVGKARYADLEHFIDKRKAMQQAVSQIVSPQDSLEEKAKKIYYRVQQMRNTSYEPSKTEQEEKREEAKKLVNVEEVWSRGFGDGVQLTWLYLALVRAAGLEADGVWVSGRNDYFFRPDVQVDSARLNANVVQLRIEGKEIYCDPGGKFTPYGLLPWYETGVSGLRLDKDGGTWIKTPLPPASASVVERKADLTLTDSGDLEGQLTITYTGLEAESHRHEERFEDEAGRRKYLEEIVKRLIPTASEPTLTNQPDWNGSASPLVAEFTLKVPGWASQTGRRVMLPVGLFSAPEKHLFDHADRVYPVYMNYPFQQKEDIAITMASGWQIGTLPPEHKQDGHIITYSLTVAKDKSTLRLNRTISVDFLLLDNKYYTALRTFFQGVKTSDDQQIVLQPAATTAGN